jgi:hypothetical protein
MNKYLVFVQSSLSNDTHGFLFYPTKYHSFVQTFLHKISLQLYHKPLDEGKLFPNINIYFLIFSEETNIQVYDIRPQNEIR